eukprot:gene37423-53255_t
MRRSTSCPAAVLRLSSAEQLGIHSTGLMDVRHAHFARISTNAALAKMYTERASFYKLRPQAPGDKEDPGDKAAGDEEDVTCHIARRLYAPPRRLTQQQRAAQAVRREPPDTSQLSAADKRLAERMHAQQST